MSGSGNVSAARIRTASAMGGASSGRGAVKSAPVSSISINHGSSAWYDTLDRLKNNTPVTFNKDYYLMDVNSAAMTDFFSYNRSDRWYEDGVEGRMSSEELYKKTGLIRKGNRFYIPKGSTWKLSVFKLNGGHDLDLSNGKISISTSPDLMDSRDKSLSISVPQSGLRKRR